MPKGRTTIFVAGFHQKTRSKELVRKFERFGRIVRYEFPVPKSLSAVAFAFIEFENYEDADKAYVELRGTQFNGRDLTVDWATPASFPPPSAKYDNQHQQFDVSDGDVEFAAASPSVCAQLPPGPHLMPSSELTCLLAALGRAEDSELDFQQYALLFARHGISANAVRSMDVADIAALGVKLGHAFLIKAKIQEADE